MQLLLLFIIQELDSTPLSKGLFGCLPPDDLFLSFDADELPKPNVLAFLKTHDGIPPVFQFNLRWTVYTFYWVHKKNVQKITTSELKQYSFHKNPFLVTYTYVSHFSFFQ